ncbi:TonB-dependent receptor [Croceicoccus mobilis]|nr:TonB-dependent receptor [Croceicoccus mobilis]
MQRKAWLLAGASLFVAGPAWAQDANDAAGSTSPPEIVVTGANKFGQDLDRAAVAATSVDAEQLDAYRITSVQDVAVRVPSLVYNNPSNFAQAFIRGLGSNFSLGGLESAVATYVDGVYLQRQNGAAIDLVDLSGVQVLKGPQGTLYGRNATGGVILIETADPTDRLEGSVMGEYGRFDSYRVQGVLNLPVSQTIAVRFSGQLKGNGDFSNNYYDSSIKRGRSRSYYGRAKVRFSPTTNFDATYMLEYMEQTSTSFSQRETLPSPYCQVCFLFGIDAPGSDDFYDNSQTDGPGVKDDVKFWAHTLTLDYASDDFTVSSVTGYRRQSTPLSDDQEFMPPDFFRSHVREHGPNFYHDTYIRTDFDGPLNVLAGGSYMDEDNTQDVGFTGLAFGDLDVRNRNEISVKSISFYGEASYDITPEVRVSAGARWNQDTKKIHVTNNDGARIALGLPEEAADFSVRARFRSLTPRLVLSYDGDAGYYYASYNRGERSGGFGSPIIAPGAAVDPETLDNFEIGAKNSFMNGLLTTSLALFYGSYKDIQVQVVDSQTGSVLLQNAAKGEVKGVEFEATLKPAGGLILSGGVTYLGNKFNSFPDANVFSPFPSYPGDADYPADAPPCGSAGAPASACGGLDGSQKLDLSGKVLPRSPKFAGFVAANYETPVFADWSLRADAIARFTTKYEFTAGAGGLLRNDIQHGYTKVDGSLALASDGGTEVGVYAQNIFGAKFLQFAQTASFGAFQVRPMPPTYGVRVKQSF